MAKRIKGITIELDGETKGLDKALGNVNKKSQDLQGELRDVEKLLKFNPGNADLVAQKHEILAEQVETTSEKLDKLKQAQSQVEQQFKSGKIDAKQYRDFQREIAETESKLDHFKGEANKAFEQVETRPAVKETGKLGKAFDKVARKAKDMKGDIKEATKKSGASAGAAAGGALAGIGGQQDSAKRLARVQTSADAAGVDMSVAKEAYKELISITGDADSAAEALSNLFSSGVDESNLLDYVNQINGAFVQFNGTLQSEGIADGIQETFAQGEAVGPFMELLERAGVDIEKFNEKLGKAKEQGEGTNFILDTLSENGYGKLLEKHKELNPEVTKQGEAQADLQSSVTSLAESLTPLLTTVTNLIGKVAEWAEENPQLMKTLVTIAGVIGTLVGVFTALWPIVSTLATLWPVLAAAFGAITAPIAGIIAGVTALVAAGIALWQNWDTVKAKAAQVWSAIKVGLLATWEIIKTVTMTVWNSIKSFFSTWWSTVKSQFSTFVNAIKNAITTVWNSIKSVTSSVWNGIKTFVLSIWDGIKNTATSVFNGIKNAVTTVWNTIKSVSSSVWNGIKNTITGIWDGLKNTVSSVFNGIKDTITGVWDSVKGSTDDIWSGITDSVKGAVNGVISAINSMIGALNNLSIPLPDIPDWVPFGGGGGGDISFPNIPKIPKLKKGTNYVEDEGMAYLHQGEAVVPKKYNPAAGGEGKGVTQYITINSPEPISPAENARKMKQASRQLAMGGVID